MRSACLVAGFLLAGGNASPWSLEALLPDGKRVAGHLHVDKDRWFIADPRGKTIPLEEIHAARFSPARSPLPQARLLHQFILSDGQVLHGELAGIDAERVRCRTSWGQMCSLPRGQVHGVVQAEGYLTALQEDFESAALPWKLSGGATIGGQHAFAGKKSLALQAPGQGASIDLPEPISAGRVSIHFFLAENPRVAMAKAALSLGNRTFVIHLGAKCEAEASPALFSTGALSVGAGWHLLQAEWQADGLRLLIDDFVLGTGKPGDFSLRGIRLESLPDQNGVWFDSIHIARKVRTLPQPQGAPSQDGLWLAEGDQLFGKVIEADDRQIVVDAPFGKRTYPWNRVRGVFLSGKGRVPVPADTVELWLRVGFGFPADRLRGRLLALEQKQLIVENAWLGKLSLPEDRLEKIVPLLANR